MNYSLADWFARADRVIHEAKEAIGEIDKGNEQNYFYDDVEQLCTDTDAMLRQICNRAGRLKRRVGRLAQSQAQPTESADPTAAGNKEER